MTNEELKMEDYFQKWNAYCDRLHQSVSNSKQIAEGIAKQKTAYFQNQLLFRKIFMLVFCLSIIIYLLANVGLYLTEVRNAVPFFIVVLIFAVSTIRYGTYLYRLSKTNRYEQSVVGFATHINKLQLYEKKEMLLSFFVALPILLFTLPQVFSVLLERQDFYGNITAHLPVLLIGCLLSISIGYVMYKKNKSAIDSLRQNINLYQSIK